MDTAEAHIEKYLQHLGFTDIIHEPDGNVPPDFLVDRRIAVEVRRLNQNEQSTGTNKGLAETAIPFAQRVQSLLEKQGPPTRGISWFVSLRFKRPIESWRTLGPRLEAWLKAFQASATPLRVIAEFGRGLTVSLVPASQLHATHFLLGGYTDSDSGGWVLRELEKNLDICIADKTKKISGVRAIPIGGLCSSIRSRSVSMRMIASSFATRSRSTIPGTE